MLRRTLLTALTTAGLCIAVPSHMAFAQASPPTFVFTAIPDQDETRLVERFTRVAEYLQKNLGVPVRYIPVKSYPAAVTAFTNDQVQLGWFGGFTGVQARRAVPGSEAIAQGVEDVAFRSYIITNAGTGLKPTGKFPHAIEGRTFTFGARASTSGRLMPEFYLRQAFGGRTPEQVFSRVGFSGDHSRTAQLVQSGAFEVGVLDYTVFEAEVRAGRIDRNQVVVLWETPTYPDYNWTIRGDVDRTFGAGFGDKVRQALLDLDDPAILAQFARTRFIPAKSADYAPVEEVAKATDLLN
jgi:phosphonate transport system substrate-binding protein